METPIAVFFPDHFSAQRFERSGVFRRRVVQGSEIRPAVLTPQMTGRVDEDESRFSGIGLHDRFDGSIDIAKLSLQFFDDFIQIHS
jgi:hypothetical protein